MKHAWVEKSFDRLILVIFALALLAMASPSDFGCGPPPTTPAKVGTR